MIVRSFEKSDYEASGDGHPTSAATASHRHDDLAELLARLQAGMALDDLIERKVLGGDRLEAAISQALVDETLSTHQPGRVARGLRQAIAARAVSRPVPLLAQLPQ
jgi:hypothetical protein